MKIHQTAIADLQVGDLFCDADTTDIASDKVLNEWYDVEVLAYDAVTLVRLGAIKAEVQDTDGSRRTVTVADPYQLVWVLK